MKKVLSAMSVLLALLCAAADAPAKKVKELKVLTIGNSFADSIFTYMPDIAKDFPDCKLVLDRANIGGCSLKRHWREFVRAEKNPDHKAYTVYGYKEIPPYTLQSKLVEQKWDIISIHQAASFAWKWESYEPYAENLIKAIRKLAPQAEIVVQQTWSFRADALQYRKWKITPRQKYEKTDECCRKLAEKYNLRIVPVGLAVEKYREQTPVKVKLCEQEELKNFKYPDLPDHRTGEVVGVTRWQYSRKTKSRYVRADVKHLNTKGRYLQACVWFGLLFDKKCSDIKFVPPAKDLVTAEDTVLLKKCAQQAIDEYKQVKK